jgi:hypothetical protein
MNWGKKNLMLKIIFTLCKGCVIYKVGLESHIGLFKPLYICLHCLILSISIFLNDG